MGVWQQPSDNDESGLNSVVAAAATVYRGYDCHTTIIIIIMIVVIWQASAIVEERASFFGGDSFPGLHFLSVPTDSLLKVQRFVR